LLGANEGASMRFDKLTTKFQQALAEAQSKALANDNGFIEPQHLLSALLEQDDGGTSSILSRAGVAVPRLKQALASSIGRLPKVEGQGGETTLTKDETINLKLNYARNQSDSLNKARLDSTKSQFISGRFNSAVIAQFTTMDINDFNRFNPDFDNQIIDGGSYNLRLPPDKMQLFEANRVKILYESMQQMLKALNEPKKAF